MKFMNQDHPFLIESDAKMSKNELASVISNGVTGHYVKQDINAVSFADVVAVDSILRIILNKDFDKITYADDKPFMTESCIKALENFTKKDEREQINIDTYKQFNKKFNMISDSLRYCNTDLYLKKFSASTMLTQDNSVLSLTFLKVIFEDEPNAEGYIRREVHYILPLPNPSPLPAPSVNMLVINGNGEAKFDTAPLLHDDVLKTDSIISNLRADDAIGYAVLDRISADKVMVINADDYDRRYKNVFKATHTTYPGIGIALSPSDDKVLTTFNSKVFISDFDAERLDTMKNDIIAYDNRTYLDKIDGPITVELLADSEISFNGFYMDEDVEEPNDKFVYSEASSATAVGRTINKVKRLPYTIKEELSSIVSKIRNYLVEHKRLKDDKLREKLINDEFVPILDGSLKWLLSGATTYGMIFVVGVGPIFGILGGAIVYIIKSIKDNDDKKRVTRTIQDELDIIDEKINDSRNSDDRQKKYAMMRMKKSLLRKLDKVNFEGKL